MTIVAYLGYDVIIITYRLIITVFLPRDAL